MLLEELDLRRPTSPDYVDFDLPAVTNKDTAAAVHTLHQSPSHEHLGTGAYAYVTARKGDQHHDVVTRTSTVNDPTLKYLNVVAGQSNNPYFPRVKRIAKDGNVASAIIERLVPYDRLIDNELLISSLHQMMFSTPPSPKKEASKSIVSNIKRALQSGDTQHIRDENLKKAVALIHTIGQQNGLSIDLHFNNIMWRITGKMPQLVITDPFDSDDIHPDDSY